MQEEEKKEPSKKEEKLSAIESFRMLAHDMVYVLTFVVLVFVFLVRIVTVSGSSMYPTLVNGDYVALLSNTIYGPEDMKDGDIVVALAPDFDEEPLVKRVIATEGQTVDIDFDRGIVYVDGVALEEPYINELTYRSFGDRGVRFPLTVQPGHVFLMGDNRNASSDSRLALIGQVDTRYVLGKVLFIAFPGFDEKTETRTVSRLGSPY